MGWGDGGGEDEGYGGLRQVAAANQPLELAELEDRADQLARQSRAASTWRA